jgi:hypothetical protein
VALFLAPGPIRGFFATVLFVAVAAVFINRAIQTRFFGVFTIVKYPYYHELVADVDREPAFVARIGAPIVVDDAGVWCPQIAVTATTSTSLCHLPVRGPRGSGDVVAQSRFSGGRLSTGLTLKVGTSEDHALI